MGKQFKRQQRTVGAVVQIPLENGFHTYGRILEVEMAFYDIYTKDDLSVEVIIKSNVLFITTVYNSAITKEECKGLEYWSVWSVENIEERLNDHFMGRKNPYVQKMKRAEMYLDKNSQTKIINSNLQKLIEKLFKAQNTLSDQ